VPAIAAGIGVLLALSEGGIDSRTRPFEIAGSFGAGLPGPGDGFGLAWPGKNFGFLRVRLSES
jgi:hypothetical protein